MNMNIAKNAKGIRWTDQNGNMRSFASKTPGYGVQSPSGL